MAHLICYVNGTSLLRRGFWSKLGLSLYQYTRDYESSIVINGFHQNKLVCIIHK